MSVPYLGAHRGQEWHRFILGVQWCAKGVGVWLLMGFQCFRVPQLMCGDSTGPAGKQQLLYILHCIPHTTAVPIISPVIWTAAQGLPWWLSGPRHCHWLQLTCVILFYDTFENDFHSSINSPSKVKLRSEKFISHNAITKIGMTCLGTICIQGSRKADILFRWDARLGTLVSLSPAGY